MITAENIRIQSRFAIGSLTDLQMTIREGCHGSLVLRGYLSDDTELDITTRDRIEVSCNGVKSGLSEMLFCGAIREAHVFVENGVRQIVLSAATASVRMDEKEECRSIQDIGMTYEQLAGQIVLSCGGKVICEKKLSVQVFLWYNTRKQTGNSSTVWLATWDLGYSAMKQQIIQ